MFETNSGIGLNDMRYRSNYGFIRTSANLFFVAKYLGASGMYGEDPVDPFGRNVLYTGKNRLLCLNVDNMCAVEERQGGISGHTMLVRM